jgi:hypothetical protein
MLKMSGLRDTCRYKCSSKFKWRVVYPEKKNQLYSSSQVTKYLEGFSKPCFAIWRSGWERRTQLGPGTVYKYHVDHLLPVLPLWWFEGRAINTEPWGRIPQYSMLLSHGPVMALVLTSSLLSALASTFPFFNIPWESISWLFFRLSLCLLLSRSLGFLELFLALPLSVFGHY